jgi:hypothetical protein
MTLVRFWTRNFISRDCASFFISGLNSPSGASIGRLVEQSIVFLAFVLGERPEGKSGVTQVTNDGANDNHKSGGDLGRSLPHLDENGKQNDAQKECHEIGCTELEKFNGNLPTTRWRAEGHVFVQNKCDDGRDNIRQNYGGHVRDVPFLEYRRTQRVKGKKYHVAKDRVQDPHREESHLHSLPTQKSGKVRLQRRRLSRADLSCAPHTRGPISTSSCPPTCLQLYRSCSPNPSSFLTM